MQPDYVPEKQDFYKDDENEGPQHILNDATGFSTSYISWDKQNTGTENMKGYRVEMLQWCRHKIISAG